MLSPQRRLLFAVPAAAAAAFAFFNRVRVVHAQEVPPPSSALRSRISGGRAQLLLDGSNEPRLVPLLIPALCRQNLLDLVLLEEQNTGYAVVKGKVLTWRDIEKMPREVKGLKDVEKMACARDGHCIAVTRAGAALHWWGADAPKKLSVDGKKVSSVSGGGRHLALLTEGGDLYTVGANEYGQLGAGDHNPRPDDPVKVAADVASVACGENHTLYVTKAGKTFGMGSNAWCQLGQKEPWETGIAAFKDPEAVPALMRKKIAKVFCGADFSLALTENGDLYTWGFGRWGQLADGQGKHVKPKPSTVQRAPFAKGEDTANVRIACGANHCLALLTNGQLWAWGANSFGQLGSGRLVMENAPVQVMKDRPLKKAFVGSNSSVVAE